MSTHGPLNLIGNTPLIRLEHLPVPGSAEVWVKWEGANPTGSMKDRMALSMIEGAEKRGLLRPGGTVVEYTGGSTGSSLAMICSAKGYQAHLVSSDAFSELKLATMRAFGARLDIVPSDNRMITAELFKEMRRRALELADQPNTFYTDQFNNPDNRSAYHALADELLRDLDGKVDEFVMGVGTAGSFSGTAEGLKKAQPSIRCIAIEPANSRALSGVGPLGGHRLEGMGPGFVAGICRLDLADEIVAVTDNDAFETARALARREGVFTGISSGSNVWAALQRSRALGPGHRVVTIAVDSGLKYLNDDLYR